MENVVLVVCVVFILWLLVSQAETQRSLRWWYNRQVMRHCQDAEMIRDGLLQDVFALRRRLELALINSPTAPETNQELLTTLERFHHGLKELSDRLSPPFLHDSLPLAMQHVLNEWQTNYPYIQIESKLPDHWPCETEAQSRLLLATLDEVLKISLAEPSRAATIRLCLTQQKTLRELTIEIQSLPQAIVVSRLQELYYLEQTFRCLMPGQCSIKQINDMIECHFRW